MNIFDCNGLCVGSKDFVIDPGNSFKTEKAVLSHAHADHIKLNNETIYFCTPETSQLIQARFKKSFKANEISFRKKISLNDFDLELFPSGHVLGSAMAKVSSPSREALITSDFKTQDSFFSKGAKPLKCDVLALETTFGLQDYIFPSREELHERIGEWVKEKSRKGMVVLAGYSLGKAQELTYICNKFAGISPIVHETIFDLNKVYESNGMDLGKFFKLEHNLSESNILIMPPGLVEKHLIATLEHFTKRKVFSAIATGWNMKGRFDECFPLSDHADFNQLLEFVEACNPQMVLTYHGFASEFSRTITKKLGIASKPLENSSQKMLQEFE